MPIDKNDLLTTLRGLSDDELASVGMVKVKAEDHPFRPQASTPDRAKKTGGPDKGIGSTSERWYQRQVGDVVAEFHETVYPDKTVVAIHRYRRTHNPVTPEYLLDGFEHSDTVIMSNLAGADEPTIWARLADHANGLVK